MWSLLLTISGFGVLMYRFVKLRKNARNLFLLLAVSSLLAFLFLTRMHERYLYPFFPYATLALGLISNAWIPYIILSGTYLLNMYHLFWSPPVPFLETNLTSFGWVLALLNIAVFLYLLRQLRRSNI